MDMDMETYRYLSMEFMEKKAEKRKKAENAKKNNL